MGRPGYQDQGQLVCPMQGESGYFTLNYLLPGAFLVAQTVKCLPTMRGTQVWSLGRKDPTSRHHILPRASAENTDSYVRWPLPRCWVHQLLCSTLNKLLTFLVPQFPHMWNRDINNAYHLGPIVKSNWINTYKALNFKWITNKGLL